MIKAVVRHLALLSLFGVALCSCNTYAFSHAVSYLATQGGKIMDGDPATHSYIGSKKNYLQNVVDGFDSNPVYALADAGYVFVKWNDGYTEPYRYEACVLGDVTVTAIFEVRK